jgi:hypothetical protein
LEIGGDRMLKKALIIIMSSVIMASIVLAIAEPAPPPPEEKEPVETAEPKSNQADQEARDRLMEERSKRLQDERLKRLSEPSDSRRWEWVPGHWEYPVGKPRTWAPGHWRKVAAKPGEKIAVKVGLDGRDWNNIQSYALKFAVVRGCLDGAWYTDKASFSKNYNFNTTFDEIIERLDIFYHDPKNQKIVVAGAVQFVSLDLKGEKAAFDLLLRLREEAASAPF